MPPKQYAQEAEKLETLIEERKYRIKQHVAALNSLQKQLKALAKPAQGS